MIVAPLTRRSSVPSDDSGLPGVSRPPSSSVRTGTAVGDDAPRRHVGLQVPPRRRIPTRGGTRHSRPSAVPLDERLVIVELVLAEQAGDRLAGGDLSGPRAERPMEPRRVVAARTAALAARPRAHRDAARQAGSSAPRCQSFPEGPPDGTAGAAEPPVAEDRRSGRFEGHCLGQPAPLHRELRYVK